MGNNPISKQEIIEFLKADFPQFKFIVEEVGERSAVLRKRIGNEDLRPGGTVSGPALVSIADAALYVAILGEIGIVALAVTTNLHINFLRKPLPTKDIIAQCQLIKVGKSLIVGQVNLYSAGDADPVAHVVGTYAIPPRNEAGKAR